MGRPCTTKPIPRRLRTTGVSTAKLAGAVLTRAMELSPPQAGSARSLAPADEVIAQSNPRGTCLDQIDSAGEVAVPPSPTVRYMPIRSGLSLPGGHLRTQDPRPTAKTPDRALNHDFGNTGTRWEMENRSLKPSLRR